VPRWSTDVNKAIATIEDSRRTHVEWRDWLNKYPNDQRAVTAGDAQHHIRCIAEYDHVLKVLRKAKELHK